MPVASSEALEVGVVRREFVEGALDEEEEGDLEKQKVGDQKWEGRVGRERSSSRLDKMTYLYFGCDSIATKTIHMINRQAMG